MKAKKSKIPSVIIRLSEGLRAAWSFAQFRLKTEQDALPKLEKATGILKDSHRTLGLSARELKTKIGEITEITEILQQNINISERASWTLDEQVQNLIEVGTEPQRDLLADIATFALNLPEWARNDHIFVSWVLNEANPHILEEGLYNEVDLERIEEIYDVVDRVRKVKRDVAGHSDS